MPRFAIPALEDKGTCGSLTLCSFFPSTWEKQRAGGYHRSFTKSLTDSVESTIYKLILQELILSVSQGRGPDRSSEGRTCIASAPQPYHGQTSGLISEGGCFRDGLLQRTRMSDIQQQPGGYQPRVQDKPTTKLGKGPERAPFCMCFRGD